MPKLLYVSANPKPESESFSLTVGRAFVNEFKKEHPDYDVEELNLFEIDLQDIDQDVLNGWGKLRQGLKLTEIEWSKVQKIDAITEQFISADHYLFSSPLWNLNIPARLKMYFDNVVIARKSIAYGADGLPIGLLKNKRAVYIQAAGGFHSQEGALFKEYAAPYIKEITQFMGIDYVGTLYIEGMAAFPDKGEEIKAKAIEEAKDLARSLIKKAVEI